MIIFFRASRQAARDFANKVRTKGISAKLHDAKGLVWLCLANPAENIYK